MNLFQLLLALFNKNNFQWYPNNSGLITGVAVAGFGSGSFVINFVQTVIINPNNLSPDVTIDDKE